jgi:hypothetical protein
VTVVTWRDESEEQVEPQDDVQVIVHEEFSGRWFPNERAGAVGQYEEVSESICDAWLKLAPEKDRGKS